MVMKFEKVSYTTHNRFINFLAVQFYESITWESDIFFSFFLVWYKQTWNGVETKILIHSPGLLGILVK